MAAHTRPITADCAQSGCPKKATVEVFTTWNDPMGKYCAPHGEAYAKRLRDADVKAGR